MEYSRTEIQEFANGVNIIHFPNLTEEEKAYRQIKLKKAAERLLKAAEKAKGVKSNGS